MPISIRDDIVYLILKKIKETGGADIHRVEFHQSDFPNQQLSISDFLGHLDYLNQKHYIDAEFSGNAYGNQEDVPDVINPEEVDIRIANTWGASDGPLPHLIKFEQAKLTQKGEKMLEDMQENPPQALQEKSNVAIADEHTPFLEKVQIKGQLADLYDARDITEVVFRTMRDMMTTDAADRVAYELHEESAQVKEKALQNEIVDLWQDTNPLVAWLSRIRPPLHIKEETFLFRIQQEAGLPPTTDPETVVQAVFSATKDELSEERIAEISDYLPGKIRQLWQTA